MFKKKKRGDIGKHKFCPICGTKLELDDNVCLKCGYSFIDRKKKHKKIKWKNVIFVIVVILAFYFSIRYFNGQSLIPTSLEDALRFSLTSNKAP